MEFKAANERIKAAFDLIPPEWDKSAISIVREIRELMTSMVDEGTSMDTGGGDACGDMWFTIGGVEYLMQVCPAKGAQSAWPLTPPK